MGHLKVERSDLDADRIIVYGRRDGPFKSFSEEKLLKGRAARGKYTGVFEMPLSVWAQAALDFLDQESNGND